VQHKQITYKTFKKYKQITYKNMNYFFFDGPASSPSRWRFLLVTSSEETVSFDASEVLVSSSSSTVLACYAFAFAFAFASAFSRATAASVHESLTRQARFSWHRFSLCLACPEGPLCSENGLRHRTPY
jgi:hypothetical protein